MSDTPDDMKDYVAVALLVIKNGHQQMSPLSEHHLTDYQKELVATCVWWLDNPYTGQKPKPAVAPPAVTM